MKPRGTWKIYWDFLDIYPDEPSPIHTGWVAMGNILKEPSIIHIDRQGFVNNWQPISEASNMSPSRFIQDPAMVTMWIVKQMAYNAEDFAIKSNKGNTYADILRREAR